MTIIKRHINDEGQANPCEALVKCRFGSSAEHHYFDTSIQREVLSPAHPLQNIISSISTEDLADQAPLLASKGAGYTPEFKKAHTDFEKKTQDYSKRLEDIISSYPIKHRSSVRMLTELPMGAGAIAGFEIFDADEEDQIVKSSASDETKMKFAKSFLDATKAENKLRALISASHVHRVV